MANLQFSITLYSTALMVNLLDVSEEYPTWLLVNKK